MSVWSNRRKAALAKPPQIDVVEELTRRVAWRICAAVYQKGVCDCKARGRGQYCEQMKLAAQRAFSEIRGE